MKKILALILVLLLSVSVCACAEKGGDKPVETTAEITEGDGFWGRAFTLKDNSEQMFSEEITKVNVQETELDEEIYDDGYITVKAKNLGYEEFYGPVVGFEIDNFSESNISVESLMVIVNGCVFPATFYAEVPAYESAEGVLYLYENELNTLKIAEIRKIEVKLSISNPDTFENIASGELTEIYFDEKVSVPSDMSYGEEIISHNGVTIHIENIKKYDSDSYDYVAGIFVANTNDKDVIVLAEDVTVNGTEIDPNCIINVPANTSAYYELSFYKPTLKENKIENIEEIIMRFCAYDSNTFESVANSEEFMIIIEEF